MFMKADLGWLRGYPVAQTADCVIWRHRVRLGITDGTETRIDSEAIRKAQFTITKLSTRFPHAMPKVVGNVDLWTRRCHALLDVLKSAVRGERNVLTDCSVAGVLSAPVDRLRKKLEQNAPALKDLTDAICWSTITEPDVGEELLEWTAQHAEWCQQTIPCIGKAGAHRTILLMADLGRTEGNSVFDALGPFLNDNRCFTTVTDDFQIVVEDFAKYFERWGRPGNPPEKPKFPPDPIPGTNEALVGHRRLPLRGPVTVQFLTWLANAKPLQRRQAVAIWTQLLSPAEMDDWEKLWAEVSVLLDEAKTRIKAVSDLRNHDYYDRRAVTMDFCYRLRALNERFASRPIEPVRVDWVVTDTKELVNRAKPRLVSAVVRLLSCVEGCVRLPLRHVLLHEVVRRVDSMSQSSLIRYVRLTTDFVRQPTMAQALHLPWQDSVTDWMRPGSHFRMRDTPLDALQWETTNTTHWPVFFQALTELCVSGDLETDLVTHLATLADVTGDPALTVRYLKQIDSAEVDSDRFELTTAVRLTSNPDSFTRIVTAICKSELDETGCLFLTSLNQRLEAAGWRGAVSQLIMDGQIRQLKLLCTLSKVAGRLSHGLTSPLKRSPTETSEWARRFPPLLQPQCDLLAASFSDGQARVESILAHDCPPPEKTLREIRAIERRLSNSRPAGSNPKTNFTLPLARESGAAGDPGRAIAQCKDIGHSVLAPLSGATGQLSPAGESKVESASVCGFRTASSATHLESRLENLRQRLNHEPNPSPARLDRLLSKLRSAEADLVCRQLTTDLMQQIRETLSAPRVPEAVFDPANAVLLGGLQGLNDPYRASGLRLFRRHLGLAQWDPASEPANQRFLQKLRARGINPDAWLSDQPDADIAADNQTIELHIARDDRDVLLMGYYFDTCLSPGSFNFFSAVTNAVDVNKIVLCARDKSGHVVGRCLLAIGDAGCIVSFRPYCHRREIPFDKYVGEVSRRLADRMNTVVESSDRVSAVVMPDWYDDGAYNLVGSSDGQSYGLQAVAGNATAKTIVDDLNAFLSPHPISADTVSFLVATGVIEQRTDLIPPLLPTIEKLAPFDDEITLRLTYCLRQTGHEDAGFQLLRRRAGAVFERVYKRSNEYSFSILRPHLTMLAELFPSQILRAIRRTRWRWVKDDLDEESKDRRRLLSLIHDRLGRRALAQQLKSPEQEDG